VDATAATAATAVVMVQQVEMAVQLEMVGAQLDWEVEAGGRAKVAMKAA